MKIGTKLCDRINDKLTAIMTGTDSEGVPLFDVKMPNGHTIEGCRLDLSHWEVESK